MMAALTQDALDKFLELRSSGDVLDDKFLQGKNLSYLNLAFANLRGLDLSETVFDGANLYRADLRCANLMRANMVGANLCEANMRYADLSLTCLLGANLYYADLHGASNVSGIPMACPESGSFIAYKKVRTSKDPYDGVIVELEIPADARRSSGTTEKCRCDKARVIRFLDHLMNDIQLDVAHSNFNPNFLYIPGATVQVKNFDTDRWNECSTGIHFFMSFRKAATYLF